ncbi:uncharacterized protein TRIADDRAFT_59539 [Trichoplax adhaerens]|uniref:G-protein coupled receptors family 1 profile domain-containing protein n=1 Tax=Trichoplax adhaerens TaxID=10228 RepID=B3S5X3_TRIAD|nr:hypothetical protein TRIADDRAFT_59539 [Trichoplax adhaerens]EDV21884.1 hypothetical protein TRIADDRAFT_59539 [Trichoplax adhaerens]|eukprot:XP_002115521.1 hypothetical protein TRIADDRAFT_59539 [Trichoplax adhaerens]
MNSMLNNSNSTNRPSMSNTQPAPDLTYSHVLMGIIGGMCIITNAFIFITIVRRKKLRTPANDILQSMFISGFLFGAVYILPKWTNLEYLRWPIYCSLSGPIGVHFTLIFNFHQCLICIDKLLALRWPLKYRISISHCKMITVIIVIWLVAAFAAFSPLMFFRPISNVYCIQRSRDMEKEALYLKIIYGLVFFVPLILMVISYTGNIYHWKSASLLFELRSMSSLISFLNISWRMPVMSESTGEKTKKSRSNYIINAAIKISDINRKFSVYPCSCFRGEPTNYRAPLI